MRSLVATAAAILTITTSVVVGRVALDQSSEITSPDIEREYQWIQKLCAKGDRLECSMLPIADMAMRGDIVAAQSALGDKWDQSDAQRATCHTVSHLIGKVAYHKIGIVDVIRTMGGGCAGGIHHGAFEEWGSSSSGESMRPIVGVVCEPLRSKGEYTLEICTHGVGHALQQSVSDWTAAVDICLEELDGGDASSCTDGVVATAVTTIQKKGGVFDFDAADKFLQNCLKLDVLPSASCVRTAAFHTFNVIPSPDIQQGFPLCDGLGDRRVNCYEGVGWALGDMNIAAPQTSAEGCARTAPEDRDACLSGAARFVAMNLLNLQEASSLCAPVKDQPLCAAVLREIPAIIAGQAALTRRAA